MYINNDDYDDDDYYDDIFINHDFIGTGSGEVALLPPSLGLSTM